MICMQCRQFTPSLPCIFCGCTVAQTQHESDRLTDISESVGERWSWYDFDSDEDAA